MDRKAAMMAGSKAPSELLEGLGDEQSAALELFWRRDLRPWEKKAAWRMLGLEAPAARARGECHAGNAANFVLCGYDQFGGGEQGAPLREGCRALHLEAYLKTALAPSREGRREMGWLRGAVAGWAALAANAAKPSGGYDLPQKVAAGAMAFAMAALPFAGVAMLPAEPAALAAALPMAGGLWTAAVAAAGAACSAAGSALAARGLQRDAPGLGQAVMEAFALLAQARAGGLYGRVSRCLRRPPRLFPLGSLLGDLEYDDLSAEGKRRVRLEEFGGAPLSKRAAQSDRVGALRGELEAIEISGGISKAAEPASEPKGAKAGHAFSALVKGWAGRRSSPAQEQSAEQPRARRPRL